MKKIPQTKPLSAILPLALAAFSLFLASLPAPPARAQVTTPSVQITATTAASGAAYSLTAAKGDNYEIAAGVLVKTVGTYGIQNSGALPNTPGVTAWFLRNSGTIAGVAAGVYVNNAPIVITNEAGALISSTSANSAHAAISINGSGAGTVDNSGTISGSYKGVFFNGAGAGTLTNRAGALVTATFAGVNANNAAVFAAGTAAGVVVRNAGLISSGVGVRLLATGLVENTGTITGLAGTGTAVYFAAGGTLALGDGSTLNGAAVAAAGTALILQGDAANTENLARFTGFSTLAKTGSGAWTLTGTAAFAGGITIATGTLALGDGGASGSLTGDIDIAAGASFYINRSDHLVLNNTLTGAGTLVKTGDGLLELTAAAARTGDTIIATGTLAGALGTGDGTLFIAAGAACIAPGAAPTLTIANLAGAGALDLNHSALVIAVATGSTAYAFTGGFLNPATDAPAFQKTGDGLLDLAAHDLAALTGAGGTTRIDAGVLKGGAGLGAIDIAGGAAYRVADGAADAVLGNLAGTGTADLNGANLVFNITTGTQNYAFAGALQNGNNLRKTGAGVLDINTHDFAGELAPTGTTFIENGLLRLAAASQLIGPLVLGTGTTRGLIEKTGGAAWTTGITLAGTTAAIGAAGGGGFVINDDTALAITIAGAGDFIKTGSATLDITTATLAHTGGIIINSGTLLANAATLGNRALAGPPAAPDGADDPPMNDPPADDPPAPLPALVFHETAAAATHTGLITGGLSLVKTGAGALILSHPDNNYTGATTIATGTLQGRIGAGTLTVNAGAVYKVADGVTGFSISGIQGAGTVDLNAASLNFAVAAGVSDTFAFTGDLTSTDPASRLIKTGAGAIVLRSAANLGGGVAVQEGTLSLADQNYINAPVALGSGATFGLIEYTGAAPWSLALALSGAAGGALSGGGFSVATGTQTLTASATVTGTGAFVKAGAGVLDITAAAMNHDGDTTVLGGTLIGDTATIKGAVTLANNATVTFAGTADATVAGAITGDGNVIKTGAGLLTLANAANDYAGDTTIVTGTLAGRIGGGALHVAAGAAYQVAATATGFSLAGISGAGAIDLAAADLTLDLATGAGRFDFAGTLAGGNRFIKTGTGTLELLSSVALPGGAAIENGAVRLADQNYIKAPVALGTGSTAGLIEYTGDAAWTKAITLAGAGGGGFIINTTATLAAAVTGTGDFIKTGPGVLDITAATMNHDGDTAILGGTLLGDTATLKGGITLANDATVVFNQAAAAGAVAGLVTGSGHLVKTGAGALHLANAANDYTGDTTVSSGTLAGHVGSGALVVNAGATYIVADGVTDFSLAGVSGSGVINLNTANLTLDAGTGVSRFDFTGQLAGGGRFIKTGTGTLELLAAIALDEGAEIRAGTLRLADQNYINAPVTLGDTVGGEAFIDYTGVAPWTRALALAGNGGFAVGAGTVAFTGTAGITGTGNFIKTGPGALDISAITSAFTGTALVREGRLTASAASLDNNPVNLAAGAALEFLQVTGGTHAAAITGSGALVKTGGGLLHLSSNANNYTGGNTVLEGMLRGTYRTIGGNVTVAAGGTLGFAGSASGTFAGDITGAGILEKTLTGTVTLTGTNTLAIKVAQGAIAGDNRNLDVDIDIAARGANSAVATPALVYNVAAGDAVTYAKTLSGAGAFEKTGAGTLVLAAASNPFAGTVVVSGGALRAALPNRLHAAASYDIKPAATLHLGGYNQSIAGLQNDGAIVFDAIINTAAGTVDRVNILTVNGDAAGSGKLYINWVDDTAGAAGANAAALILVEGENTASYTAAFAGATPVTGIREWGVVSRGSEVLLTPWELLPEIPAAAALPTLAHLLARAGLDTLAQRFGELRDTAGAGAGFWARGIYTENRLRGQLFDGLAIRSTGGQAGVSWRFANAADPRRRLDLGLGITMLNADADYLGKATLDARSNSAALHATWLRENFHTSLVAGLSRDEYTVTAARRRSDLAFKSRGVAASLETGYTLRTARLGAFVPAAQITWQAQTFGEAADGSRRSYAIDAQDSLLARAALRWSMVLGPADGAWKAVPYARAALGRDFRARQTITVAGIPFENDLGGPEKTIETGLTILVSDKTSLYASAAWTAARAIRTTRLAAGARIAW
jgi:autotransporter-associated beta strand protein